MPFKRVAINQGRQPRALVKRSRRQGEGGQKVGSAFALRQAGSGGAGRLKLLLQQPRPPLMRLEVLH